MQQLRVVDLQEHAGDLPCQVGMHVLNQWEETLTWKGTDGGREKVKPCSCVMVYKEKQSFSHLTQHLLLLLRWSCSQHGRSQGLLTLHMYCRLERPQTGF